MMDDDRVLIPPRGVTDAAAIAVALLRRLMQQFFDDSDELLNEVVKIACDLCGSESAGVTLTGWHLFELPEGE